jgi:formate--tetrahydrofolate ligase
MAILALARDREDLRRRINDIVVGFDLDGGVVRASDIRATGGMMVLLNEAIMPNLVQTTEGAPALVHAGPFANIAHGTSSVISQKMALRLADYVVNETGFAADLGAEKYFDLVMPSAGTQPALAVLIASARALCAQDPTGTIRAGLPNLHRHIDNLRKFRVPVLVAINRFSGDTPEQLDEIAADCLARGIDSAVVDAFGQGGEGAVELAEKAISLLDREPAEYPRPLYDHGLGLVTKIETVAREIYGAAGVYIESEARKKIQKYESAGFGNLPICVAKTQSSLSDNPKLLGAPTGWTMTVSDARLAAGAGFVIVIAGNMMLMPGLGKTPQAVFMDVDPSGAIQGLR